MSGIDLSNGSNEVLESLITTQDVEVAVKGYLGPNVEVINYQINAYSKEKPGFMAGHRYLVVTFKGGSSKENEIQTFFVKYVPYDNEEQAIVIQENRAFYKETMFYKLILPELVSGIKDKSWYTQCYLIKDDVLILEDLKFKNYFNKSTSLDLSDLKSAVIALAKLHGASIIAENRLGKSLKELYPEVFEECMFVQRGKYSKLFRTGIDVTVAIAKYLNLDATIVSKIMNRIFSFVTCSKTRRNAVCHGDAWPNNFMFNDSQSFTNCVMVDFQLVRYVPMMTDVAQLLYLTMGREFREKNEKLLLFTYYSALCEALRDTYEIIPPSFNEIQEDYEAMKLVGIISAALYIPVILMDAKVLAELIKDYKGYAEFFYSNRVDIVLDYMKDYSLYKKRNCEIVEEMIERSNELLNVTL